MKLRLATALALAVSLSLAVAVASAGAALVGLYRNSMDSDAQRAQIVKYGGERCARGGSTTALRIYVGKQTPQCSYRTPVIGRDLEIAAVGRLLDTTPRPVQRRAYLGLELRSGEAGAGYQLLLYPLQRKTQLRKVMPDGSVRYLHVERNVASRGLNEANQLRLRAFNITSGPEKGNCRILAFVGKQVVADVTDPAAGELQGRFSGISLGAAGNALGTTGSFDDIVVRIPSPF